ncbi:DUF4328 domain-containing protein [Planctomycetota bacterium]|nr:DUF4328 domain-containing protein [Planctomycetota bacterium]
MSNFVLVAVSLIGLGLMTWWGGRAHDNARALGAQRMFFEGEWLIWIWFTPLLNMVALPLMWQELWRASDPNAGVSDGNGWRWSRWSKRIWVCAGLWWLGYFALGCWVVSWILVDNVQLLVRVIAELVLLVGWMFLCGSGIRAVWSVHKRQHDRFVARKEYLAKRMDEKLGAEKLVEVGLGGNEVRFASGGVEEAMQ